MSVRTQDVNSAMMSILKKMEVMTESTKQSYEESVLILGSVESVMKNQVSTELKKQTSILMSIESKLKSSSESKDLGDPKKYSQILGNLAKGLNEVITSVKKLDSKSGANLENFFNTLSDSLSKIESKDLKGLSDYLNLIGKNILKFGSSLALYSIIGAPSMLGAALFGKTVGIVKSTVGEINEDQFKGVDSLLSTSTNILKFGSSLALYSIIGIPALLGAVLFGSSIKTILSIVGTVDEDRIKQAKIASDLGLSPLKFAASMVLFLAAAPLVLLGTALFGLSVRTLLATTGAVSKEDTEGIKSIIGIGKNVLLYSVSLILFSAVSPLVLLGSALFGLSVRLLILTSGLAGQQKQSNFNAPLKLALGVLLYSITMTAVSLMAPAVLIGTLIISASLFALSIALNRFSNPSIRKGVLSVLISAPVIFLLSMTLMMSSSPLVGLGALLVSGSIFLISLALQFAGNRLSQILKGSLALTIASMSILPFTFSLMFFANSGITFIDSLVASASIGLISLALFLAGKGFMEILKGSVVMAAASLALIGISYGLTVFKSANMTIEDAAILGLTVGGLAIVMGLAGLASPYIIAGSLALGIAGLSILAMSYSLKEFQKLKWSDGDNENLRYTIKSVLGALSGTDEREGIGANISGAIGQGLQSIVSLFAIGPLLLGSAAIWLMSEALAKFKSVGWDSSQSDVLSGTIVSVLGALSGTGPGAPQVSITDKILNNIVAMFAVGPLLLGSAAIWLMSEALIKFKTVGWDQNQTAILGNTISTVLGSLQGQSPTVTGGVTSSSNILDTILQLLGAGNLIFAAGSIWLLSDALIKFKTVKWSDGDTKSLSYTISEILSVISGGEKDGGLFSKITGAAKSLIGTAGSIGNATSLGLAGASILSLSEGLLKWKTVGWGPGQTKNLKDTITSLLGVLTSDDLGVLDPAVNQSIKTRMSYFNSFAANIQTISNNADNFSKVAQNFDKIQQSMKLTKDSINGMDLKKLTLTDSLMKSLAIIAKNPEAMAAAIEKGIGEAFDDLIKAIKDLAEDTKENSKNMKESQIQSPAINMAAVKPAPIAQNPQTPTASPKSEMSPEQLKQAFMSALAAYFGSNDIKVEVVR